MTTQTIHKRTGKRSGFYIEVGCPGCGGSLDLEENFFITTCHHCGSVLRLVKPNVPPAYLVPGCLPRRELRFALDRFLKKNHLPLTDSDLQIKALYYPFWKMDAALVKVRNQVEKIQVSSETNYEPVYEKGRQSTDIRVSPYSLTVSAAVGVDGIPDSIGLRAELIKLRPFSDENIDTEFDVCKISRPWEYAYERICSTVRSLGEVNPAAFGTNVTELFYPRFAVIYSPYYIIESYHSGYRRFLVDGVTSRVLKYKAGAKELIDEKDKSGQADHEFDINKIAHDLNNSDESFENSPQEVIDFGQLGVEFHRCTTCGIDLPDEKSYLYICSNCHEFKTVDQTVLPISNIYEAAAGQFPHERLFPFWAFKIPPDQKADLRPLFGGIYESDRIVIPAFEAQNFEAQYRLAKRMSAAYPQFDLSGVEGFDQRFSAIQISMEEAIAAANITIFRRQLSKSCKTGALLSKRIDFQPAKVSVMYAPFKLEQYFYVDCQLGSVTFEKTLG